MATFIARRFLVLLATLLAASAAVFIILEILPGDPALLILGMEASDEALDVLRAEMGFDRPPVERYLVWIGDLAQGRLGTSHTYAVPVAELIAERLVVTVPLALMAFVLAVALAVPLGMFAATHQNRIGDWGVIGFSQIGLSIPNFWFGSMLVLVFAVSLNWLPAGGFPGWEAGLWTGLGALLIPAISLSLPEAAILTRVTRSAVLENMAADYVRTARAKGVSEGAILRRHVLRHALIPMTTIIGLQFAVLVAGSIVIERLFSLPGLGRLILQAVTQRDVIVVRDVVMALVAFVVAVSFVVDIANSLIDPRPKARA